MILSHNIEMNENLLRVGCGQELLNKSSCLSTEGRGKCSYSKTATKTPTKTGYRGFSLYAFAILFPQLSF